MSMGIPVEKVRLAIIERIVAGRTSLRPSTLIKNISVDTLEREIAVKQALASLSKEGWLEGVARDGTPFAQVKILGEIPQRTLDPIELLWIEAMTAEGLSDSEVSILNKNYQKLSGFSLLDLRLIVRGLLYIRKNVIELKNTPAYIISARYLLSSSKLLGELSSKSLMKFGIDMSQFSSHPPYIVVGGATAPETVILVENPASFELALRTKAAERCAFIATYGFGLSKADSEYGNQLAGLVESSFSGAITLIREGSSCPSARELLKHSRITFWGDLDPAGIKIYMRLKHRLSQLTLSALYLPMAKVITDHNNGHPYVDATKKPGQFDMKVDCYPEDIKAKWLLELCQSRGVDQEVVTAHEISDLAGQSL